MTWQIRSVAYTLSGWRQYRVLNM